jgi:hypothetical protein
MNETVELSLFFERAGRSTDGFPAESYVAGYREPGSDHVAVEITLPGELVEQAVLTGSCLAVSLSPDGRLTLHADGLGDEVLAAATGAVRQQTIESLVADCLDPELLAGEDDALGELTSLRAQLSRALTQLDGTLERLKRR